MKDKQSSESRRKLLKSIATGSGAIIAGKSLPESWAKPVVDSVMLPVHAQTTSCDLDSIPGRTVVCSQTAELQAIYYTIRSSESPCGFDISEFTSVPSTPYVRVDLDNRFGSAFIRVESIDESSGIIGNREVFLECSNPDNNNAESFPLGAVDETGMQYSLNGQFSVDTSGLSVSMSALTITPV